MYNNNNNNKTKRIMEVDYVKIYNEENGFIIFNGRDINDKNGKYLSVKGTTFNIDTGDIVECIGVETIHPKFGVQFTAEEINLYTPTDTNSILNYLQTGYIRGISKKTAENIVNLFGDKTINILDNNPERLREVKGIGVKTLNKIITDWNEKRIFNKQNEALIELGFSFNDALKLTNIYKDNAFNAVKANPYSLLESDLFNFSFDFIDKISLKKLNVKENDVIRILTFLNYETKKEELQGHTYIYENILLERALKKLRQPIDDIKLILEASIIKKILYKEKIETNFIIQSKRIHNAEEIIISNIKRLSKAKNKIFISNIEEKIKRIEQDLFPLYPEQKNAVINSIKNKINIINGGPGVGKTTILKIIVTLLKQEHYTVSLCAPTGKASQRMSEATNEKASTIHRLLEYKQIFKDFQKNEINQLESDFIIIDEMSMVDIHLLAKTLKAVNSNSIILIIGDTNQIPSVSAGSVLKDLINSNVINISKITINRRQSEKSEIIKNAYLINDGKQIEYKKEKNSDMFFINSNSDENTLLKILEMIKTNIPNAFGIDSKKDLQVLCPTHEGLLGRKNLNKKLQELLNVENDKSIIKRGDVIFKEDDNIIQTKNNVEKDIFNGDTGVILKIEKNLLLARINNKVISYDRNEFDQIELSYAITIHKSQGSEYPVVILPISEYYIGNYDRSLLYTGITRGKLFVIVIGNKNRFEQIIKNDYSRRRRSILSLKLKNQFHD